MDANFYMGDLYPGIWGMQSTRGNTIPEGAEQNHYNESDVRTPVSVPAEASGSVWLGLAVLVGIIFLLNM